MHYLANTTSRGTRRASVRERTTVGKFGLLYGPDFSLSSERTASPNPVDASAEWAGFSTEPRTSR
jgi:hypothetical protein